MKLSFLSPIRRAMSPRRWMRMPLVLGAVVALVLGLGGGTAFAYFTSSGHGSGVASTGTPQSVTVVQATGTVTNKLYPGDATGDLLVELDNPNSYPVNIVGISPGTGSVTVLGGSGTCTTTGVTVNTLTGLSGLAVASDPTPPNNPVSVVVPSAVSMSAASSNGCQGVTFQVPVTITVHKG